MSSDNTCDVHQVLEPVRIDSSILRAPLSPPPTIKKYTSFFFPSPLRDEKHQNISRKCTYGALRPCKYPRRTQVTTFYILATLLGLFCWWRSGHVQNLEYLKQRASDIKKNLLLPQALEGLHFIPASNRNFHYVGRWTYTPNRLRRDNSFAGAYLEFGVQNCSSLYVSLHNTDVHLTNQKKTLRLRDMTAVPNLEFRPLSKQTRPAPPVSLVSRIDEHEHKYFHRSGKGLVAIAADDLDASVNHVIRILASQDEDDDKDYEGMQFEGIWLNDGGSIISWQKQSNRSAVVLEAASLPLTTSAKLSQSSVETSGLEKDRSSLGSHHLLSGRRKTLEIVSDVPQILRNQVNNESLAALNRYGNLMGDIFGVDHVSMALSGMCLTSPCIGGIGQPANIKDAFFRSGPPGSPSFPRSWNFRAYIPDALVLVLGSSDHASFRKHFREDEMTHQDFQRHFEEAYLKFVQAIRKAAYPLHPAALHDYASNSDGFVYNSAPATIPMFVVTPFTGEMRQSTQTVVEKLQSEGDKAVFWLDTSGWFASEDFDSRNSRGTTGKGTLLLNSQGNRKAATFLHAHLCHYLADDQARCPFLKHEAYTGKVYVPKDVELDKVMEDSKIRKLKSLFWHGDEEQPQGSDEGLK